MTDTHPDLIVATLEEERAPVELHAEDHAAESETATPAPAAAEPSADEVSRAQAHALALRTLEAVLFAAPEPLELKAIAKRLPKDSDVEELAQELEAQYANRGIHLVRTGNKLSF